MRGCAVGKPYQQVRNNQVGQRGMAKWKTLAKKILGCVAIMFSVAGCFSAPAPGVTPTPDVALVAARQTIDAVLLGGNPHTPHPVDVTPAGIQDTPNPLESVTPTPDLAATTAYEIWLIGTAGFGDVYQPAPSLTPDLTATQEMMIATAIAATLTAQVTPSPTSDAAATQAAVMATAVAATLTAQATPTPTPDLAATQAAMMATAVAATLTAQATPTPTPDLAATQGALLATAIAKTLTAQPTPTHTPAPTWTPIPTRTPSPVPAAASPYAELAASLRQRAQSSWVPATYPAERDRFITALTDHLGEFQLPNLGITTRTMSDALWRSDAGDRANAIVNQVWGDWLTKDVGPGRLDAYRSDPGQANLSPFRQLVIRLIQGRQGRLVDNQQHGLHSLFTRREESHVWVDNVNGVIGAINRESFLWP